MSIMKDNIFRKNPVFFLLLGLCPTLAITTTIENAIGMGIATTLVLVFSSIIISLIRHNIPEKIRIPSFIVIIATMVTIAEILMQALAPSLHSSLGIYVPLIVVNCIVLGRALSCAYRNTIGISFIDALGTGIGFTFALLIISFIREILGTGGINLLGFSLEFNLPTFAVMILPPGALLVMGLLLALMNTFRGDS